MDWVADHRKHHAHTDQEGDPHSPHVGHGSGLSGLWHAHVGWLLENQGQADWKRYAPELYEDPAMRRIGKRLPSLAFLSLLIPTRRRLRAERVYAAGALQGYIWGGLVRIFFVHHVTWSVNSVCHFFGSRRFDVEDHSTNVGWLAVLSLGESWHHNHHAFPRSAYHGLRWLRDRSLGPDDLGHAAPGVGLERRPDHPGAPAGQSPARVAAAARGGRWRLNVQPRAPRPVRRPPPVRTNDSRRSRTRARRPGSA